MGLALEAKLKEIGTRYEILALYAFGSRSEEISNWVHGEEVVSSRYPCSDVDIAVHPAPGRRLTAQERVRLVIELEDLLKVNRVDLVVLPEADPFLAVDIIRGEILYCADADAQAEYELYVLRRTGDLAHYARERWQQILTKTTP